MMNIAEPVPSRPYSLASSSEPLEMLDRIASTLPHQPHDTLDLLFLWLHAKRRQVSSQQWCTFVTQFRQHPLCQQLHADPLTYRAYAKLRGYPGDAALLDLIYSAEDQELEPNDLAHEAQSVFRYTRMSPASRAVRLRRRRIAELVDTVAARVNRPRVLSIAAGHLREASLAHSCIEQRLGEWVALDQDRESLSRIAHDYARLGVVPRQGTVRSVLRGGRDRYDCVYAAGLLDYLPQQTGQRLINAMFALLNPGGELLVTNFVPEISDVGYMECVMDWHLIYRTPEEMLDLAALVPNEQVKRLTLSSESDRHLIFLRITRKG